MKTTRIATYSTNPSNQVSHFSEDGQTVPVKSSTSACLQNEELSSTVKDYQQTKEAIKTTLGDFLLLHILLKI